MKWTLTKDVVATKDTDIILWQYSGEGLLTSFEFSMNGTSDFEFWLEMDGVSMPKLHYNDDLEDELSLNGREGNPQSMITIYKKSNRRVVRFISPYEPIEFEVSAKLYVRSGANNKTVTRTLVVYKEGQ